MKKYIEAQQTISDELLNLIAYLPTKSLDKIIDADFWQNLSDIHFMRIAVLLAQKGYEEGGCPIGGVVIDNSSRKILGKGHNTLVQEDHPYNHGETSAIRDAGRINFSKTTIFTTLSPCDICATLVYMRGFSRIVIGDITNAQGNEKLLKDKGIQVDIIEDTLGVALYYKYSQERPELNIEDWRGKAAL
jgi:creatinine deaminase